MLTSRLHRASRTLFLSFTSCVDYKVLFLLAFSLSCMAAPQSSQDQDSTLDYVGTDRYNFQYDLSGGGFRKEEGHLRNGVWIVSGTISTYDAYGNPKLTYYVADNKGYRTKDVNSIADGDYWLEKNGVKDINDADELLYRIPVSKKTLSSLLG